MRAPDSTGKLIHLSSAGAAEDRANEPLWVAQVQDDSIAKEVAAQAKVDDERVPPSYAETLVPNGENLIVGLFHYEAASYGKSWAKWYGHFQIVEGDYAMRPILGVWNAPKPGARLGPGHKLFIDYETIVGRRPPPVPKRRPERFLELFLTGVLIEVSTRHVTHRMDPRAREWIERPHGTQYSVIDRILGITDGCPFVLRGRR